MNLDKVNIFELASKRLQWTADRQRTISENIANADVSGYRAREVESFDTYLARTERSEARTSAQVIESEEAWGASIGSNNVVLEEQLLDANSAGGQYRAAVSLYRKAYEMVSIVATGR